MHTQTHTLRTQLQAAAASCWLEACAVAAALMLGAYARAPLPFSPVPVTLQTFALLYAACTLRRGRVMAGAGLYLALGLAGAPLFAAPVGPTLGYLAGFVAAPAVIARCRGKALGLAAAMGVIYAAGAGWLCVWSGRGLSEAICLGILPFVPGDAVKAAAVWRLTRRTAPTA